MKKFVSLFIFSILLGGSAAQASIELRGNCRTQNFRTVLKDQAEILKDKILQSLRAKGVSVSDYILEAAPKIYSPEGYVENTFVLSIVTRDNAKMVVKVESQASQTSAEKVDGMRYLTRDGENSCELTGFVTAAQLINPKDDVVVMSFDLQPPN